MCVCVCISVPIKFNRRFTFDGMFSVRLLFVVEAGVARFIYYAEHYIHKQVVHKPQHLIAQHFRTPIVKILCSRNEFVSLFLRSCQCMSEFEFDYGSRFNFKIHAVTNSIFHTFFVPMQSSLVQSGHLKTILQLCSDAQLTNQIVKMTVQD